MPVILAIYAAIAVSVLLLTAFLLGRKRYGWALLALCLIMPASLVLWYQATRVDLVASWLYPSDTVYASQFSPRQFRKVFKGMDRQELVKLLGQPLERRVNADRQEYWYYSQPGRHSQNYWNFIVIVDPASEKVTDQHEEFYTD